MWRPTQQHPPGGLCISSPACSASHILQQCLVDNHLKACLLFLPGPALDLEADAPAFHAACVCGPELLLDPLPQQLSRVRQCARARRGDLADGGLADGDVFLTRHSNLNNIHVAFHCVAGPAWLAHMPSGAAEATLLRVLSVCAALHVRHLAVDFTPLSPARVEGLLQPLLAAAAACERERLQQRQRQRLLLLKASLASVEPEEALVAPMVVHNGLQLKLYVAPDSYDSVRDTLQRMEL